MVGISPATGSFHCCSNRIVADVGRTNLCSVGSDRAGRELERNRNDKVRTQSDPARTLPLDTAPDLHGAAHFTRGNSDVAGRVESISWFCAGPVCTLSQSET